VRLCAAAACCLVGCSSTPPRPQVSIPVDPAPYHAAWIGAADWLLGQEIATPEGVVWAADPHDPQTVDASLYSGYSGVVLFLAEAGKASGDPRYTEAARKGAAALRAAVDKEPGNGLYVGLGGIAFVLTRVAELTGDSADREAARKAIEKVIAAARPQGRGLDWADPAGSPSAINDIVSGTAGTGLVLLWASRELSLPEAKEVAIKAGRRLVDLAEPAEPHGEGRRWLLTAGFDRIYPNFSHGTAGAAYFLAALAQETGDREFLETAERGARFLETIATPVGDGCLLYRHEPDAKNLYYLGWCHGPAGTARLFYRLSTVTGDSAWWDFGLRLARGVVASGVPDKPQTGFWNVSQCCGSAGVADYAATMYRLTHRPEYMVLAKRMSDDLLARATHDTAGWRWIQAENRTEPKVLIAQTGLMQGAAGIGMWLLRYESLLAGSDAGVALPDSPFRQSEPLASSGCVPSGVDSHQSGSGGKKQRAVAGIARADQKTDQAPKPSNRPVRGRGPIGLIPLEEAR
jgi:lantibiotic modifying enzyme